MTLQFPAQPPWLKKIARFIALRTPAEPMCCLAAICAISALS
jgi:hypothetical protein